jgi:hypothetical protein
MNSNLDRAMAAAREYRETAEREGSHHAKCHQLRDQIFGWVGRWDDNGKPILPQIVRKAMGLSEGKYEAVP